MQSAINLSSNQQSMIPDAIYHPAILPEYVGNPLVEALPQFRLAGEMTNAFGRFILPVGNELRILSCAARMLAIMGLDDYLEPLPYHFDVINKIGLIIRAGYRNRNPRYPEYGKALVEFYRQTMVEGKICPLLPSSAPTAPSASLFGVSGTGKTSIVERTLAFLPPMICHPQYGFVQIVHVKLDCPADGSLKQELLALLRKIDYMIGTNYRNELGRGATVDSLILDVAKVLANHHCGMLVIDEIQNLLDASGIGQAKMINTLVSFANEAKIPTFVIGTPRALSLLEKTFREARRTGDHGSFVWDTLRPGVEHSYFLKALWKYQWLKKALVLTDELTKTVHQLTQGIPVLIVRLFQLSQLQAIRDGSEQLTINLITHVAQEKFKLVEPMLKALRSGSKKAIQTYEDLLHTGLKEIKEDVVEQGRMATLQEAAQSRNQIWADRIRTLSILIQMGFEQDPTQKIVENLFNLQPNLTCDKAVRLILESVHASAGGKGDSDSESLKDIVQKGSASGSGAITALEAAGFVRTKLKEN